MRDTFPNRLLRRAVTITAVVAAAGLVLATLPLLVGVALLVDALGSRRRRARLGTVRMLGVLLTLVLLETAGLVALLAVFVASIGSAPRRHALTSRIQAFYTAAHFSSVTRIFGLRLRVDGSDALKQGNFLLFLRHASLIDTLLPGVLVTLPHGLTLRYVLKRELLYAPCLDIAGHLLRNHFVDRSGVDSVAEQRAVGALATDLPPDAGVVLFPEGTRFSELKRRSLIERSRDDALLHARAQELANVLPVRAGGARALFEAAPEADLVVVAHTGLEGFARLSDVWAGDLVGRTIEVKVWRFPAASLPAGADARFTFLEERWRELDAWIGTRRAARSAG